MCIDSNKNVRTICYYSSISGKVSWYFASSRSNLDIRFSKKICWKELKLNIEIASDLEIESEPSNNNYPSKSNLVSILTSNLQKAIRRQNLNSAIESAITLFNIDPLGLVRRLAIIIVEDVILLEEFPYLLFITATYPMVKPNLNIILRMVECLVKSNERDYLPDDFIVENVSLNSLLDVENGNLDDLEISLIYSLYLRSSYGGSQCDIDMLVGYGQLWKERFLGKERDHWKQYLLKIPITLDEMIVGATSNTFNETSFNKSLLINECVDYHVYPQMLKDINYYIKPTGISDDRLKKIIWYCRSGINTRGNSDDFLKYKERYIGIFTKIERLLNKYSNHKINEV
jgi:hypothetical protein